MNFTVFSRNLTPHKNKQKQINNNNCKNCEQNLRKVLKHTKLLDIGFCKLWMADAGSYGRKLWQGIYYTLNPKVDDKKRLGQHRTIPKVRQAASHHSDYLDSRSIFLRGVSQYFFPFLSKHIEILNLHR